MNTPYEKFKSTEEWMVVEKAIQELIDNQDISLSTPTEYVVGYIVKQIIKTGRSNTPDDLS